MSKETIEILREISSKKAEIVDQTPFDLFEDNLALQVIEVSTYQVALKTHFNYLITKEEKCLKKFQKVGDTLMQG